MIGTSWWADMMHLPSLASHREAEVAAICGGNQDRAAEMAGKYGIKQVFTDCREVIDRGGIDAVVISVPDDLHHEMAIDAKLCVLCGKPLAVSLPQAREMHERAEAAGVKHMTCFTNRWVPMMRHLHRLITDGYVGDPVPVEFHCMSGFGFTAEYRWRFDGRRCLGVLGDHRSHMIDLARWYFGDNRPVSASLKADGKHLGLDGGPIESATDTAHLITECQNACHGFVNVSCVAHIADRGLAGRFVFHGRDGTLEVSSNMREGYSIRDVRCDEKTFDDLPIPADLFGGIQPSAPAMGHGVSERSSRPGRRIGRSRNWLWRRSEVWQSRMYGLSR